MRICCGSDHGNIAQMSLPEILSKIKKGPAEIHDTGEGAAVVALTLHCKLLCSPLDTHVHRTSAVDHFLKLSIHLKQQMAGCLILRSTVSNFHLFMLYWRQKCEEVVLQGAHFHVGLMIKAGYQVTPSPGHGSVAPSSDWNSRFTNEWVFEYSR